MNKFKKILCLSLTFIMIFAMCTFTAGANGSDANTIPPVSPETNFPFPVYIRISSFDINTQIFTMNDNMGNTEIFLEDGTPVEIVNGALRTRSSGYQFISMLSYVSMPVPDPEYPAYMSGSIMLIAPNGAEIIYSTEGIDTKATIYSIDGLSYDTYPLVETITVKYSSYDNVYYYEYSDCVGRIFYFFPQGDGIRVENGRILGYYDDTPYRLFTVDYPPLTGSQDDVRFKDDAILIFEGFNKDHLFFYQAAAPINGGKTLILTSTSGGTVIYD